MKRATQPAAYGVSTLADDSEVFGTYSSRLGELLPVLLSIAAVLFLFSGTLGPPKQAVPKVLALLPEQENVPIVNGQGFGDNAVFPTAIPVTSGDSLRRFGSWMGSDASTGTAYSAWFRPVSEFSLLVAGYPFGYGCSVVIEAEESGGSFVRTALPQSGNPGETWQTETISFASRHIIRFRIVAVDASALPQGWVGFSQPFQLLHADTAELSKQLLLVFLTGAAALVAMLFPGLFLRHRSVKLGRRPLPFLWIPLAGFLGLAALGLLCWTGPSSLHVRTISQLVLGPVLTFGLYHLLRFPLSSYTSKLERRVLLVILVLASLGISKSIYSVGPVGELYGGQISRTLEVGDRSDSRIPYHVLQLVASRQRPYSDLATTFFSPWNFSSRGPLVALAASSIVLAAPFRVPDTMPDQPWTVFDPQGFSAYRIVMIVIACCALIAVFGVAGLFLDPPWALLAFLVTASTPFVIHETYFTWPKLEAVWFFLLAAYLIVRSRYVKAGLLLGIGYLCHPLVLLSLPALLGIVIILETSGTKHRLPLLQRLYASGLRAVSLLPGLGLCLLIWFLINRRHYSQNRFIDYFYAADGLTPTIGHWLLSRWNSICNTLVPLNLFLLHRTHPSVNSVGGTSPAIVQFYFQYWNTLPFGIGISYFIFLIRFLWESFFRARAWLLLVFVLPFVLFSAYWGPISTGMLREGLHPWVVGLMIFSVAMWKKMDARNTYSAACSVALLLRGVETILMLLLPSIVSQHQLLAAQFALTDTVALLGMAASVGWLYWSTFRCAWRLSVSRPSPLSEALSD